MDKYTWDIHKWEDNAAVEMNELHRSTLLTWINLKKHLN